MSVQATGGEIRPISHQSTNDKVFALVLPHLRAGARVVDVGAGEGYFSKMVGDRVAADGQSPDSVLSACDLFPEFFRYAGVRCDPINADGTLPYADDSFDVVCSLEVVEHIKDQFAFARELFRVAKPGGVAVVSTPNVLNLNSRVRYLHSGFTVLFDPLLLSSDDPRHTSGHINPVPYYYLAYQLRRAGFRSVTAEYDRFKTSARLLLALWGPFVGVAHALFRRRLEAKKPDVAGENVELLGELNSVRMLTSRSVIAVARK
ncbi:MAG TPA: methyltransferase domain-containing protein [Gemmatimonadaceae bacterium]|jgi:SAM-dependent methyltransferase|nr:methyltransferase domain-containing protein [Gemmatimonadaceae bacterium]